MWIPDTVTLLVVTLLASLAYIVTINKSFI